MTEKLTTVNDFAKKLIEILPASQTTEDENYISWLIERQLKECTQAIAQELIETLNDFFRLHPMTQLQLAELLGTSVKTITAWNCGDRSISNETIRHLNRLHILFVLGVENPPKVRQAKREVITSC